MLGLALLLGGGPFARAIDRLQLSIGGLTHPAFELHDIELGFAAGGSPPRLRIGRLRVGASAWRDILLACPQASLVRDGVACLAGTLHVGGRRLPLQVDFTFDPVSTHLRVDLRLPSGASLSLVHDGERRFDARLNQVSIDELAMLASLFDAGPADALRRYGASGRIDARLVWGPPSPGGRDVVRFEGRLSDVGFSSEDGLHAGEQLAVSFDASATATTSGWNWQLRAAWEQGEAYLHPFYLQAGPVLQAQGQVGAEQIRIETASLTMEGVQQLALSASLWRGGLVLDRLAVSLASGDLAVLGPRWLAPLLAPALVERLRFAGTMSAGLTMDAGVLTGLELVFDQAGVSLAGAAGDRGLAFGPVSGHVPWRANAQTQADLRIEGGHWEALSLGAFDVRARLKCGQVVFSPMQVPVLDGVLALEGLELTRHAEGWQGRADVVLEPLSMQALTDAVGLPQMAGVVSASLPGVRFSHGELTLDGALVVSVFDGYLHVTGLRVSEPFGLASHLQADVEARHIDLGQLTDTFSFGSITGFADLDLKGLELVRWRPTRFDARLASSPGDYRRRISQRAVQNISALGGAGAMAALQRGLLGMFETFGYREIGLSCTLANGICDMEGMARGERADGGFRIVRGGGIPALDVIGYNRRVDWHELLGRIQRVIEDNVTPELH
ncbi:hypothetical protein [Thauera sp.]|uniref:hypothetical protein n=1 Tax=Thauera sp. TaxID=1905334 RepID=UPI0025797991|nr:hypothetical protein [Thauera sp.]